VSGVEQLSAAVLMDCIVFENFPSESRTPEQFRLLLSNWEKEDFENARLASSHTKTKSKLKEFLQFVTGTVAIQHGTSITIQYEKSNSRMPTVQTCTSTMQLPDYLSFDEIRRSFEIAIQPENAHMEDS